MSGHRSRAVAALAAIGSQLVCGCATMAADPQPAWRPTPPQSVAFRPLKPAAPAPDFVPAEDVDKAFPRRLSDDIDIDMAMVLEVIVLILAVGNAPNSPKKARAGATPEP